MSEKRVYNLRSVGSEALMLPVQFEVSDDRFMSRLLQCQQNTSKSGQVSDSDSGSDNNDTMSNAESDTEQTGVSESAGLYEQVACSSNDTRGLYRGHGGRVVTLSPPTSEAGVRSPSWP